MKSAAALVFLLLAATPATAASLEEAQAAIDVGNYTGALSSARELAEAGDARAMTMLGIMYRRGQGVRANLDTAIDWLSRAADLDQAPAQLALALIYLDPNSGFADYPKGEGWLRRAAGSGNADVCVRRPAACNCGNNKRVSNHGPIMWLARVCSMPSGDNWNVSSKAPAL